MKKLLIIFILLSITKNILCLNSINPEEEVLAKDLLNHLKIYFETDDTFHYSSFAINNSYIYIADIRHCQIFVYSKETKKRITTFGQPGQGPSDLDGIHYLDCTDDFVYVTSATKLSIFDPLGKHITEFRLNTFFFSIVPFKDKFIGTEQKKINRTERCYTFSVFESNMINKKILFNLDIQFPVSNEKGKTIYDYFPDCRKAIVYKDHIYIGCTDEGFNIHVFDTEGKKLYDIKKNEKQEPVTDELKNHILRLDKKAMGDNFKDFFNKREYYFHEYFPSYINFFISNDKIFVFKYPDSHLENFNRKNEVIMMDLKGNILSRKLIHMQSLYSKLIKPDLFPGVEYYFYEGTLYLSIQKEESTCLLSVDVESILKRGIHL